MEIVDLRAGRQRGLHLMRTGGVVGEEDLRMRRFQPPDRLLMLRAVRGGLFVGERVPV